MIDLSGIRLGSVTGNTGTADPRRLDSTKDGDFMENLRDEVSLRIKTSQAEQVQIEGGNHKMRTCRLKYMPTMICMSEDGCTVSYGFSDGGEWNADEMTCDEWSCMLDRVDEMARAMGWDTEGMPIYIIPPNVAQRIEADDAYADRLYGLLHGGAPGHILVVDEKGRFTDLGADELFRAPTESKDREDNGDDFWKERLERQAEYTRYVQQERLEHTREVTRKFAALRGFA